MRNFVVLGTRSVFPPVCRLLQTGGCFFLLLLVAHQINRQNTEQP